MSEFYQTNTFSQKRLSGWHDHKTVTCYLQPTETYFPLTNCLLMSSRSPKMTSWWRTETVLSTFSWLAVWWSGHSMTFRQLRETDSLLKGRNLFFLQRAAKGLKVWLQCWEVRSPRLCMNPTPEVCHVNVSSSCNKHPLHCSLTNMLAYLACEPVMRRQRWQLRAVDYKVVSSALRGDHTDNCFCVCLLPSCTWAEDDAVYSSKLVKKNWLGRERDARGQSSPLFWPSVHCSSCLYSCKLDYFYLPFLELVDFIFMTCVFSWTVTILTLEIRSGL